MGQVTSKYRLVVYMPDGDKQGYLDRPASWSASLPVNDLGALSLQYSPTTPGSEYLREPCEVAVEAYRQDSRSWIEVRNGRYRLIETTADKAAGIADMPIYRLVSYGSLMDGVVVIPGKYGKPENYDTDGKRKFLSATVGQILTTILAEARSIVDNLVPGLRFDFTPTVDSAGKAWSKKITIYYEPGLSLWTVLQNLAQQGQCDFWFEGRTLMVVNPDSASARTSILLDPAYCLEAPVRTTVAGLLHTALLVGDEGMVWRVDNTGTPTPWGTSMKVLTQGGVRNEATARELLGTELEAGSRVRSEYTWQTQLKVIDWVPGVDLQAGDWVMFHTETGYVQMRAYQITISYDKTATKITLTLNDRFEDAQVRQARRLKGIMNGASGDAGTSSVPTAKDVAKAVPAQVGGLVAESEGYWEADIARSLVRVSFASVMLDVNGLAIDIDHYEVSVAGKIVNSQDTTNIVIDGLAPATTVGVQVTAVSRDGVRGASAYANITTVYPDSKLDPPTVLSTSCKTGIISLIWDGKLQAQGGEPYLPPAHFDHLIIEESSDQAEWIVVEDTLKVAVLDRQAATGNILYYRALAVDRLGNKSEPSPVVSVQVVNELAEQINTALAVQEAQQIAVDQASQDLALLHSKLDAADLDLSEVRLSVTTAQAAADSARQAADKASADAQEAAGLAAGKGKVIYQATAPTGGNAARENLWIRTSDNKPHTFDGSKWVAVTDKVAADAAQAAVAAKAAADAAQKQADSALSAAQAAQSTADAATIAAQDAHNAAVMAARDVAQAQTDLTDFKTRAGSIWADPSFEQGTGPVPVLTAYIERIQEATSAHDGKWCIRYTANGNGSNLYGNYGYVDVIPGHTYIVSVWVRGSDDTVGYSLQLQNWDGSKVNGAIVAINNVKPGVGWTYYEAEITPTQKRLRYRSCLSAQTNTAANQGKQIWLDELRLIDVTEQVTRLQKLTDAASTAQARADNAYTLAASKAAQADFVKLQASVNGKNGITVSTAAPSGSGITAGDTWWRVDASNRVYGQWTWNGSSWQAATIRSEVIANLDVNKLQVISSATMNEAVAKKLFTDVVVANRGEFNSLIVSSDNLIVNPFFDNQGLSYQYAATRFATPPELFRGHQYAMTMPQRPAGSSPMTIYAVKPEYAARTPVEAGAKYYAEYWAYTTKTLPATGSGFACQIYGYDSIDSATTVGNQLVGSRIKPGDVPVGQWFKVGGATFTMPDKAAYAFIYPTVYFDAGTVPNDAEIFVGYMCLKPVVGSVLIENGAVSADKIAAGAVTASKLTVDQAMVNKLAVTDLWAGKINTSMLTTGDSYSGSVSISQAGIKIKGTSAGKLTLTPAGLEAYNTGGTRTVKIDANGDASFTGTITGSTITGGTITGSTIRTAVSGARWEINTSGISAYDSSGSVKAKITSTGFAVMNGSQILGELKARTQTTNSLARGIQIALNDATYISLGFNDYDSFLVDQNGGYYGRQPGAFFALPIWAREGFALAGLSDQDSLNEPVWRFDFGTYQIQGVGRLPALRWSSGGKIEAALVFSQNGLYFVDSGGQRKIS